MLWDDYNIPEETRRELIIKMMIEDVRNKSDRLKYSETAQALATDKSAPLPLATHPAEWSVSNNNEAVDVPSLRERFFFSRTRYAIIQELFFPSPFKAKNILPRGIVVKNIFDSVIA